MPVLVEMGWGGKVTAPGAIRWTDITRRVDQVQGVTISRGASDELSDTQPGTASLILDNSDGALTPGNPNSPFAPYVRRNAPLRISQAVMPVRSGAAPYSLNMMGDTFDSAAADPSMWPIVEGGAAWVNGRLRLPLVSGVTARVASVREWKLAGASLPVKLPPVMPAVNGSSAASINFWIYSETAGQRLRWSFVVTTGLLRAASEVSGADGGIVYVPYDPAQHVWVRFRETSGTLYFETSPDGWDWAVERSLPTPAWVTTDTVRVEFTASRTGGTADYVEWDLLGARVRPRFYGMVNEFPVQWAGLMSTVSISATDLFKRLNRQPALRSMAAEEILRAGPRAYYPLTEGSGATSAGNIAARSWPALTIAQAGSGGTLDMGGAEGPPATGEQVPLFTPASSSAGKYLSVDIGSRIPESDPSGHGSGEHGAVLFECWFQTTTQGRVLMSWRDGGPDAFETGIRFSLEAGTGKLRLDERFGGNFGGATAATPNLADGAWHHLVYSNVSAVQRAWVDGVSYALASLQTSDLRVLEVGAYRGTALWAGSVAHVAIYVDTGDGPYGSDLAEHYAAGMTGYEGEYADDRITRLASYAGVQSVTVQGMLHDQVAGQGQGGSGAMARMREVEATESGRLFAERDYYGLAYQSRDLRYNPQAADEVFTISYADLETGSVQLADDDQKLCNQVEASRPGGATQVVSDAASLEENGVYGQQLSLLKMTDTAVQNAASWIVARFADPQPELREVPIEAATLGYTFFLDVLDADISSYFSVYDLPAQSSASEIRCTVEGYTETIKENSHVIQFRTSASARDSVWVLDDPDYSVLGSTTRLAY